MASTWLARASRLHTITPSCRTPVPWLPLRPGTGKTTVARRVGTLFASLGLLSDGEVVACSASDFVTGFANQSGGKTREVFERALGRVLFIDEAYRCVSIWGSSRGRRKAVPRCVHVAALKRATSNHQGTSVKLCGREAVGAPLNLLGRHVRHVQLLS